MKKQLFIFIILTLFIVFLFGFLVFCRHNGDKIVDETRTVFIKKKDNGFQLFRNGKPFYIQGASGNSHFNDLSSINGNTIRLYDTLNLSNFLDEANRYGLAVIVDLPLPQYNKKYNFYLNEENTNILKQRIKVFIKKHKNHPALLMWNLGNELFYPFIFRKNNFVNTFNELIDYIHKEDPNHPVCTSIAGVSRKAVTSIYLHSPQIDVLSYNIFGNTKDFYKNVSQISFLFGARPYYISEWGSDGMWESRLTAWHAPIEQTSTKKAEQINTRYNIITEKKDAACLGSLVFFWGDKHEFTYTWFSFYKDGCKSEIIKELKNLWENTNRKPALIGLDYMLVDGKGAADNIVFLPNEIKTAEVQFSNGKSDSVIIRWEIYQDAWYNGWLEKKLKTKVKPKELADSFIGVYNNRAMFITPKEEGPYRIFAYVYDKNGYFATTNTPFYVLENK